MANRKSPKRHPNLGGTLRPAAPEARRRYLFTDFTPEEHEEVYLYCKERNLSMSQFVAELLLEDAKVSKTRRNEKVIVTVQLELTALEADKLESLVRLSGKPSAGAYIKDELLERSFKIKRVHSPIRPKMFRCYLSDEEHKTILQHLEKIGISARNYPALLALRAIRKTQRKQQ
jgi:hypothetical protein